MSFAKKIGAALLFVAFAGLGTFPFAAGPTPFRPWKIEGFVNATENYTRLDVTIHSNGKPVTGLKVRIMDHPAEDRGGGVYGCLVQESLAVPGSPLTVTLQAAGAAGQVAPTLTATITPVRQIVVHSPSDQAHVAAITPKLSASWSGGAAPYTLTVQEAEQPNNTVYGAQNLVEKTHAIPMNHCQPGKEYLVNVFCWTGPFAFDHPVDSSSSFVLIQRSPYVHLHVR